MSIQEEIIQFAATLPLWEQDLIRRLATQASLSEAELDEIQAMLFAEHEVLLPPAAPLPVPISKDHFGSADVALPKTILLSLRDAAHTNRLATGQVLPFAVDGLTIIYGDNGSGKSGYARLLKALCRARRDRVEPILGNVYEAVKEPPAKATITFRSDSSVQAIPWTDGTPPPVELCRISVFDGGTAPLYADRPNQIEFLPQGLDVIPRLGAALTKLAARIDQELATLRQLTSAPLPQAPAGSKAAALLGRLAASAPKPLPSVEEIQAQAVWDGVSEQRLATLASELKALEEPGKLAARHARAAAVLKGLKNQVSSAEETLNACALDDIEQRMAKLAAARAAAAFAANEQFASDPFGSHVGTDPWRKLYEYARQFSLRVYPEEPFPAVGPDRYCVLCQQPLQPAAIDRFLRFKAFIENAAQQEAEQTEGELQGFQKSLRLVAFRARAELETQLGEFADLRPEFAELRNQVLAYAEAATAHAVALGSRLANQSDSQAIPARPVSILSKLVSAIGELEAAAGRLNDMTANKGQLAALQKEHDELTGQKVLRDHLAALLERRGQLERQHLLGLCRKACDTTAVSLKGNALRNRYLTKDFTDRITAETRALGLDYLPLKIESRAEKGASFIGPALNKSGAEKASTVLSEGEFRCLALACFLAEISSIPGTDGVILDDPVCSLDHRHSRQLARRLVAEAKQRQVILFTHDLSFYYELWQAAMEESVPVARHWVSLTAKDCCGTVLIDAAPWQAKKVKERVQELEEQLKALPNPDTTDIQDYQRAVEDFYSRVRETWERLVEERLFNGAVGRFQPGVKTQSLSGVVVEDSDFEKVYRAMTKVSNYSGHDRAVSKQPLLPDKDEMKRDLAELRDYDGLLRKRASETQKKRTASVEAPAKAELVV